ncbi:MAG: cytidine deaminase, partial [Oscillochloris sp.]|nr:cytidine deaminase [Oscillochloris sp.]
MSQPDYTALITAAIEARRRAYAPYSHFYVGAAVLTAGGNIFQGGNIENAAYPMTICAERVALFSAYGAGEREIVAMAVVTSTEDVASPCGACRQVISELAPHCEIVLLNLNGAQRIVSPQDLLPHGFGPIQLESATPKKLP